MMNKLRKSFRESFRRKKKDRTPESSKPHQWEDDEKSVRAGDCSFPVKYLGNVEVFEPRGMQVCEEALKILRASRKRPIKGQLYVTGDGLRVVDDDKKGLIVDQTIEKVSFCAPDRTNERGFSYICRDGTTRRWMCHGFHAESGERLSHAVGCAFAICLERKREREKRNLLASTIPTQVNQGASGSNSLAAQSKQSSTQQQLAQNQPVPSTSSSNGFQRNGPLRQSASISQRLKDPQISKPIVLKPAVKPVINPYAIERPHATPQLLERQGSFRGFSALSSASPFKRQLSLRLSELPSTISRQSRSSSIATDRAHSNDGSAGYCNSSLVTSPPTTTPRNELSSVSSAPEQPDNPFVISNEPTDVNSTITDMCKELTQGLSILTKEELTATLPDGDEVFASPSHSMINTDSSTNGTQGGSPAPVASQALPVNPSPAKSPFAPSKSPTGASVAPAGPPLTKKHLSSHATRSMSLTNSCAPRSGPEFRRPAPLPPSSQAIASNDKSKESSITPKLASVSTSTFAKTVDLGGIIPNDIDDPFDAEWTNVIANLPHSSVPSSDTNDAQSNTLTQVDTNDEATDEVSTNPFSISSASPVTSGHTSPGLKKEFNVKI